MFALFPVVALLLALKVHAKSVSDVSIRSVDRMNELEHLVVEELAAASSSSSNDSISSVICQSVEATTYLGFLCGSVTTNVTYDMHALAIGDWGSEMNLDSCCNRYRQTGTGNEEYYKDQQAQPNVAYLLELATKETTPKLIIGHGDNFYWDGLGSADVDYRFTNTFEAMYDADELLDIKWINVVGNHDLGGAAFICGARDNEFVECSGTTELLKVLDEKFTRQSGYTSPNNDRWYMPSRYYVESLTNEDSTITVDIFNVDTNAAATHGAHQICCQCYGYKTKYSGSVDCNTVQRGDTYCAGGDTDMYDSCVAKIEEWEEDSLTQLARDAKASTATWKIVNTHYSPHFHFEPNMMNDWNEVLADTGIQLFMNGHTHAESHEFGSFNTHFITNGAGGGIQSESVGTPPSYATEISSIWIADNAPYGIFRLSFAKKQMRVQFLTFDDNWEFKAAKSDTVKGGLEIGHCWLIPLDGSRGTSCD